MNKIIAMIAIMAIIAIIAIIITITIITTNTLISLLNNCFDVLNCCVSFCALVLFHYFVLGRLFAEHDEERSCIDFEC